MFISGKKRRINRKDISKKINWLLGRNFFSINEFVKLSSRQQYKALKMIAKIEVLQTTRHELKDIIKIINNEFDGNLEKIKLLLPSLITPAWFNIVTKRIIYIFTTFVFVITFLSNKFELMRN